MDKAQALNQFWNSFGWKAYDENTVPDDAVLPRITYNIVTDNLEHPVMMYASLWERSSSWENITKKSEEIGDAIVKLYPPALKIDNGRIYITKGTPFAQRMGDSSNNMIRRIYLNIEVEYFTET